MCSTHPCKSCVQVQPRAPQPSRLPSIFQNATPKPGTLTPRLTVAQAEDVPEAAAASVAETDARSRPARRGVLSEIQRLQQDRSRLMIPKTAFSRLRTDLAKDLAGKRGLEATFAFQTNAFDTLQYAAEWYMTDCFSDLNVLAVHRSRVFTRRARPQMPQALAATL